jgi:hypothetical protein
MVVAPPFPEPWGWNQLTNGTDINIINASIEVYKHSGDGNFVMIVTWSLLPLLVAFLIYNKSQKVFPAALGMILVTQGLFTFNLIHGFMLNVIYIITVIAISLVWALITNRGN